MIRLLAVCCLLSVALAESPSISMPSPEQLPGEGMMFNGWRISPAGEHTALPGDMPLKMLTAPDGKVAVADRKSVV